MCGRFYLKLLADDIAQALGARLAPGVVWQPRYNIAPTQGILIVRRAGEAAGAGERELTMARWGLVPRWADDPAIGARLINARAESVASKPAFREAFARRRCLVPASGFFEWQAAGAPKAPKRPFRIERQRSGSDGALLTMAGLWEETERPKPKVERSNPAGAMSEASLRTATILTTDAPQGLARIHSRTPVFLEGAAREIWLDPEATVQQLEAILKPAPEGLLVATEISRAVNKPENDEPSILAPAPDEGPDAGLLF